jgi:hypothetical protein
VVSLRESTACHLLVKWTSREITRRGRPRRCSLSGAFGDSTTIEISLSRIHMVSGLVLERMWMTKAVQRIVMSLPCSRLSLAGLMHRAPTVMTRVAMRRGITTLPSEMSDSFTRINYHDRHPRPNRPFFSLTTVPIRPLIGFGIPTLRME